MELLIAYVVLGALAALAQGDWRVRQLAKNTLLWPALVPRMLRQDPSPPDPPQLVAWEARINASLASLKSAIEDKRLLGDPAVGQKLLTDTQSDLVGIARRHAELDTVLERMRQGAGPATTNLASRFTQWNTDRRARRAVQTM